MSQGHYNPCLTPDGAPLSIPRANFRLYCTGEETGQKLGCYECIEGIINLHWRRAWIFHCFWFCRLLPCDWCSKGQSDQWELCRFCIHVIYHRTSSPDFQPNVISVAEPEMGEHSFSGTSAHRLQCSDQTYWFKPIIHSTYVLLL